MQINIQSKSAPRPCPVQRLAVIIAGKEVIQWGWEGGGHGEGSISPLKADLKKGSSPSGDTEIRVKGLYSLSLFCRFVLFLFS